MRHKVLKSILVAGALSVVTIVSCNAVKVANDIKFSDVPETFWAYGTITEMTQDGLFKGTTEPVNGVGTFSPEKVMSRAEFITVSLRAIYPDEMEAIQKDNEIWWMSFYDFAMKKGIIQADELDDGDLDKPMSREEMAMILVRAVEQNGEILERRVEISKIADYDTIDNNYKEYVLDCFSFGLLCGVDEIGTFAPAKFLTRAEGAEVLCRVLKKDKRVKVNYVSSGGSYGGSSSGVADSGNFAPWEKGGKKPIEYTWEEFEALSNEMQETFFEWFDTAEAFDEWMEKAQNVGVNIEVPWEKDGKNPTEYTWDEFNALSDVQQEAFFEWFDTAEAFEKWMEKAQNAGANIEVPWEKGGRKPDEYTWEEFSVLDDAQQEAFFEWFDTAEAFEKWMEKAQNSGANIEVPWEKGGKKPDEYTWEEFSVLDDAQQEAFFEWFDTPENFDLWMESVKSNQIEIPWENGGKLPKDYSWEEFDALSDAQQEMFFEWFHTVEEFDAWLKRSPFSGVSKDYISK